MEIPKQPELAPGEKVMKQNKPKEQPFFFMSIFFPTTIDQWGHPYAALANKADLSSMGKAFFLRFFRVRMQTSTKL